MMLPAGAIYRPFSSRSVRQGDIAIAEVVQLRGRSGDRPLPGRRDDRRADSAGQVPSLGEPREFDLEYEGVADRLERRVLRLWSSPVMVLHQNCEIDFASEDDSRLIVAPVLAQAEWPEGPWGLFRNNQVPGYFHLPGLDADQTAALGVPGPWPESVVALASSSSSSYGLIKPSRMLSLAQEALPALQDTIDRFFTTRGLADLTALQSIVGKRVVRVAETGQTVSAPSPLVKVYFGDEADDAGDDEGTYCFWGVRRPRVRASP
ncbi:MAG: hypothetical protein M3406_16155 [Chloroflexota bacterium]|nr:hypothetical protein [Chloroflexota bacterium]